MEKERFSMLLLEPGEVYFEDFRCTLLAKSMSFKGNQLIEQDGRLKLCSKSMVFEPKDLMKPILKIMLKYCTRVELLSDSKSSSELLKKSSNGIVIECNQHVRMLESNAVAPYEFHHDPVRFEITLNYSGVSDVLARITQLQRASTLPLPEQSLMLSAITFSRQSRCSFDNLWLGDLFEEIVLESQGKKVTPLVMNPGRIVLTSAALYFQPFNDVETHPVTKIKLEYILRIIKRRFLLQQLGVELYCSKGASVPHLYLTFVSAQKRDEFYDAVCAQPSVKLQDDKQEAVILQWQHGVISNYDYLLYLNSVADRTFNDLTQYPVFPWVIADYTSSTLDLNSPSTFRDLTKPMGALNETRYKNLKERYDDMPEPKFLYGSHYSTPGFVLFYLVRKFPQYMLCLQNGRFDHPDRMFNSVADVWRNVLSSNTDFKELVPEFYDTTNKGDFLVNMYGINFGYRTNGSRVDDVALPPWASDPADFVKKLREALESDYVSKNLHHWIDLVFGYKQRGANAIKAKNVFYHLCYEGSVDLEGETDEVKKHALEVQIMEFGQIPKQVFDRPHPARFMSRPETPFTAVNTGTAPDTNRRVFKYECTERIKCHRGAVAAMKLMDDAAEVVATVGDDSMLKCYSFKDNQQVHGVPLGAAPLNDVDILPGARRLVVASQNMSVYIYDIEFGRIVEELEAHNDMVTCVAWSRNPEDGFMVTGSTDEVVMIWRHLNSGEPWRRISRTRPIELEHESPVTCIALKGDDSLLVTGCVDGSVFLWSSDGSKLHQIFKKHNGAVSAVSFNNDFRQLATCGALDGVLRIIDLSTAVTVCHKELGEGISSLFWMFNTIVVGTVRGNIIVWDVPHASVVQMCSAHQGATLCVAVSNDCDTILSGGEDGLMCVWKSISN